jgi:hypothetical protein
MKNTKNLLITGVTLAIALFASVQVVAMEQNQINPKLLPVQIQITRDRIEQNTRNIQRYNNQNSSEYDPEQVQYYNSALQLEKDVLYGTAMHKGQKINPYLMSHEIGQIQRQLSSFSADPKSPRGKYEEQKRKCLGKLLYGNRAVSPEEIMYCE